MVVMYLLLKYGVNLLSDFRKGILSLTTDYMTDDVTSTTQQLLCSAVARSRDKTEFIFNTFTHPW